MAGSVELSDDIVKLLQTKEPTPETTAKLVSALKKNGSLANAICKKRFDSRPLHIAAFAGSKDLVATILDYNADINATTSKGLTPLHRASAAEHGPVVRFLLEKGAEIDPVDADGRTPLVAVSVTGKDEIMNILLEFKANVNFQNKETKRTALHEAVLEEHGACVELLLKYKAEVNAQDSEGNTPLHLAANKNSEAMVNVLLHKNADISLKNSGQFTPHELGNKSIKKLIDSIKGEESKAALLERGAIKPKAVKWFICGRSGAGKTTLMNATLRKWVDRMMTKEKKEDRPLDVHERTPGINIVHGVFGEAGELTAHDLAGQAEYFPAHGLFFNADNTIFSMVVSLEDDGKEMFKYVCYWLQFIIASLESKPGGAKREKPPLSLVMSRADKFKKLSTEKTGHSSRVAELLLRNIIEKFDDYFDIHRYVFVLDCQVSNSDGIKIFRAYLRTTKDRLIDRQECVPTVCNSVAKKVLPKLVSKGVTYMSHADFSQQLRKKVDPRLKEETIDQIVGYLHKQGQVVSLKQRKDDRQAHTVVTSPNWLCSDVIGTIMAPVSFLKHITHRSDGKVTKAELCDVFGREYKMDDVIPMLKMLEICFQRENEANVFQFPCHLAIDRPANVWLPDDRMKVYGGRRIECEDKVTTMISPVSFPRFQVRAQTKFKFGPQCMWRGGIKALDESGCEILVQQNAVTTSIDVVVRGVAGSQKRCRDTLTRVLSMINNILLETSPGTTTYELVLSSSHLSGMSKDPLCYSQDMIDEALKTNGVVVDQSQAKAETLYELLVDLTRAVTDGLSEEDSAKIRLVAGEGKAALVAIDVEDVSQEAVKYVADRIARVGEAFIQHMGPERVFAQAGRGVAAVATVSAKKTKP